MREPMVLPKRAASLEAVHHEPQVKRLNLKVTCEVCGQHMAGRCACLSGHKVVDGECERETFGSCGPLCDTIPQSQCDKDFKCSCKEGFTHKIQDGLASCVAHQCSRTKTCRDPEKRCVDNQCVCAPGRRDSANCEPYQDTALQVVDKETPAYKTALLLSGGMAVFVLVAVVPVIGLKNWKSRTGVGRSLETKRFVSTMNSLRSTTVVGAETRAPKRPYPFENSFG